MIRMPAKADGIGRDQLLLFGVMLTLAVGTTGLQSVLPALGRSLDLPDPVIALAFSLSALAWAVSASFWAKRLTRNGPKRMVMIGMWGFVISTLLAAGALTVGVLGIVGAGIAFAGFIVGRCIYGLFGAAAPPAAQAIIVSKTPREERTKALALLASAFGLGTIIGPALAPFFVLPVVGLAGPAYVFAVLGLIVMLFVRRTLPDVALTQDARGAPMADATIGGEPSDASAITATSEERQVKVKMTDPRIWPWMVIGLIGGHAQAIAGQTVAFLTIDRSGMAPELAQPLIGMVLMAGAGSALLAQWGVIPRLGLKPRALVIWGSALSAAGCLGLSLAHNFHAIAVAFGIASLGFGFLRPGFTAGASLAVTAEEQGVVAGHVTANSGYGFVLAPAAGILMYGVWEPLPYLVSAVAMIAMVFYSRRTIASGGDFG